MVTDQSFRIEIKGDLLSHPKHVRWSADQLRDLIKRKDLVFINGRRAPHRRADFNYPWSTICRRSMLPVVNCAGCQLGLHRPPDRLRPVR